MKNLHIIGMLLGMGLSLTACSEDETKVAVGKNILLTNYVVEDESTEQTAYLEGGSRTGLFVADAAGEPLHDNLCLVAGTNGSFSSDKPMVWSAESTGLSFYAYSPYNEAWRGGMEQLYRFSVQTNQNTEENFRASDLLFGVPAKGNPVRPTTNEVPIAFRHLLNKVSIHISDQNNKDADPQSYKVRLLNLITSTMFNPATGQLLPITSAANGNISLYTSAGNTRAKKGVTFSGIIIPQAIPSGKAFIEMVIAGEVVRYALPENLDASGEKEHIYDVTIDDSGIKVSTTVSSWEAQDETNLELSQPTEEETWVKDPTQKGLDIYLCLGGSNMAGRATVPAALSEEMPNVSLLNNENRFEPAKNPLN